MKDKNAKRLLTQNLLASARLFEEDVNWDSSSIEDLATFIDMFCLYDSGVLLTGPFDSDVNTQKSDFYGLLKDEKFVEFRDVSRGELDPIVQVADRHLQAFLGTRSTKFADLLSSAVNSRVTKFGYWPGPDFENDIDVGVKWLRSLDDSKDHSATIHDLMRRNDQTAYRGTYFLVRTFLYYAYSDIREIPFAPDATRLPVVSRILNHQEHLREQILSALQTSFQNFPIEGERELRRKIPPFAAYIFTLAAGREGKPITKRRSMLVEMQRLRHQLAPMRAALRKTEESMQSMLSRDDALRLERDWVNAIEQIKKEFGHAPETITLKRGLGLASNLLNVLLSPWNPISWASLLSGAGFDVAKDVMARGPAIEIHKLRSQLPSPTGLRTAVNKLI